MKIQDKYKEFCKEVTKIAESYGLSKLHMKFTPGFDDWKEKLWQDEIQCSWNAGRHGADTKRFNLSSTITLYVDMDDEEKQSD